MNVEGMGVSGAAQTEALFRLRNMAKPPTIPRPTTKVTPIPRSPLTLMPKFSSWTPLTL